MSDNDIYAAFIIFDAKDKLSGSDFERFKSEFFIMLESNQPTQARELIEAVGENLK